MSIISYPKRPPSKRPEGDSNSVWSKLVHRAEACPQCGNRICLVSERILHPTRKFSCSYCGCISHTPFYAYLMPIAFTAISVSKFYDSPIYYKMGSRFRDVGLLCIVVYSLTGLLAMLVFSLKEKKQRAEKVKPAAAKRQEILRQRAEPKHNAAAAALSDMGRRLGAHLPSRLREYMRSCGEEAMKQVQANLSCPNCGKQVVSARKRILYGLFLSGTCPYCETGYKGGLIAPMISAVIGMSIYLDLGMFVETIPFLPQLLLNIISLFVVLPLCLFIPSCIIGAIGILIFPLREA